MKKKEEEQSAKLIRCGMGLVLGGVAQCLGVLQGTPVLRLGALHALGMGCLASLMLAAAEGGGPTP